MTNLINAASGSVRGVVRENGNAYIDVTAVRSSKPLVFRKGGKPDGEIVETHHATEAVLSDRPERWVGQPVTLNHPKRPNGRIRLVSEDDFARLTPTPVVGDIVAASVSEGDLNFRIKVDEQEVNRRGYQLEDLREVSQSAVQAPFKVRHDGSKEWTRFIKPDHLALLTDQPGACSNGDGCGLHLLAAGSGECAGDCECDSCAPGGTMTKTKDGSEGGDGTDPKESTLVSQLGKLSPADLLGTLKEAGLDLAAMVKEAVKPSEGNDGAGEGTPEPAPTAAGSGESGSGKGFEIPEGMSLVETEKLARMERATEGFEAMEAEKKSAIADKLIACGAYKEDERKSLMATPLSGLTDLEERFAKVAPRQRPNLKVVGAGSNAQGSGPDGSGNSGVVVPPSLEKIRERQAAAGGTR